MAPGTAVSVWLARQPPLDSTRTGAKSKGNLEVQGPGTLPCACRSHEEECPATRTPREGTGWTQSRVSGGHLPGSGHHVCLGHLPLDTGVTVQRRAGAPTCVPRRGRGRTSLSAGPHRGGRRPGGQSQQQGRRQEPAQYRQDSLQQSRGRQPPQNQGSAWTSDTLGDSWACYLDRAGQLPETRGAGAGGAGREESGPGRPSQKVPRAATPRAESTTQHQSLLNSLTQHL